MLSSRSVASTRGGFTLVEMLVAVTLVVMMMLMFAQMFGTAVSTMREQRALANNDQKARAITALVRGDLDAMTYKSQLYSDSMGLVALYSGDVVDPNQKGYFYIAENDPGSETDDLLQFTIWVTEPIAGRAQLIGRPDGSGADASDLNQPDGDDGILDNGTTWSRAAEVSYFLRGGTLFRRVLLLRDPLPHNPLYPGQPTLNAGGEGADVGGTYYDRLTPVAYDASADQSAPEVGDFWNDFDSSASWAWLSDDDGDGGPTAAPADSWRVQFHSIDSLDNNRGYENSALALPWNRFGHHYVSGQPLEFLGTGYIGRFTHEETSHPDFGYPGISASGFDDPYEYEINTGLTLFGDTVTEYADGPRAGEDIVMTGVEAFNIEVLDEGWTLSDGTPSDRDEGGFPKFVNLGQEEYPAGNGGDPNNEFAGDFAITRIGNPSYDSGGGFDGNRYDTWHPGASAGGDIEPPYRPLYSLNTTDYSVYTTWAADFDYALGDVLVLGAAAGRNESIAYECIGDSGISGAATEEPEWPLVPGVEFYDNEILWRSIDNRIGLKMMRITVRYIDTQTGGLKQLSIYHSFVESR